jgi:hypothetical protein
VTLEFKNSTIFIYAFTMRTAYPVIYSKYSFIYFFRLIWFIDCWCLTPHHLLQYFSYIMVTSFSGGRNRSTRRESCRFIRTHYSYSEQASLCSFTLMLPASGEANSLWFDPSKIAELALSKKHSLTELPPPIFFIFCLHIYVQWNFLISLLLNPFLYFNFSS